MIEAFAHQIHAQMLTHQESTIKTIPMPHPQLGRGRGTVKLRRTKIYSYMVMESSSELFNTAYQKR